LGDKIFRDTRTQIGILKSRGIKIKSKKFAKQILLSINYYNLINGYKIPFIATTTPYETYLPGTSFNEIYALYEFDRKLRILTLEVILKIEKQVKSTIAYCFSKEHGHKDYLSYNNFDSIGKNKYKHVSDLFNSLYKKIVLNIDKDHSITHYVNGKNYIPLWVLVNTLSFGDMSKLYSNMLSHDRNEVAKRIKWGLREDYMSSCLILISSIRNRCAHDELLYSYQSYAFIKQNNYLKYFQKTDTNNYFSNIVAFKMLLSQREYALFQTSLEELLNKLSKELSTINISKIRNLMGFPSNWTRLKTL
jgi:abortive infection bacteriophage resistance protein